MRRKETIKIRNYRNESGASIVDYAVLVSLISVVVLASVKVMGIEVGNTLCNTAIKVKEADDLATIPFTGSLNTSTGKCQYCNLIGCWDV